MTKKLVAISLVLVLVLGLCATAFAAYPQVTIDPRSKSQYVRKGKTIKFKLRCDSGDYGLQYGYGSSGYGYYYRAEYDEKITKGSSTVGTDNWNYFSGVGTTTEKWRINTSKGKYKYNVLTYYRPSYSGTIWYLTKKVKTTFHVY